MSSRFYPAITAESLIPIKAVRGLLAQDPDYLNEAPYDAQTKQFLAELCGAKVSSAPAVTLETPEDLERELVALFNDLKTLQKDIQNVDARDKVQWAKAIVSILDRLIELRERNLNLKMLAEFQRTVITIMDEVLEPHQKTEISQRLQKFL